VPGAGEVVRWRCGVLVYSVWKDDEIYSGVVLH